MLGEKIRELRKEKGMNQSEFAKEIGISRNYLSEIENGKKNPGDTVIKKIIDAFKLPKNYFKNTGTPQEITYELKIKEVNRIKHKIVSDMKSLDVYKKEFDSTIDVYADLVYHYHRMMRLYEEDGYPVENWEGKKPVIVTQLEALRKDIVTYSDRLMLNPKSYQSLTDNKKPPESKLAQALMNFG